MKSWGEFYASLTKRAASAQLIIENSQGKVLVVKASYKPYWSLPGGVIDANETPKTTALREVREEVGLDCPQQDVHFFATIVRKSPRAITYLFVFRCFIADSNLDVQIDNREIIDYDWVSKQDVCSRRHGRHFNRAVKNWADANPQSYIESTVEPSLPSR